MANYVLVDADQLDADLTKVANKIRSKGGTSAKLAFPSGFESAVDAITINSGITVQTKSGDFTTNSSGSATVNCGFAPDVVFITKNETSSGSRYDGAIPFALSPTSTFDIALWTTNSKYEVYDLRNIMRSTTGFSLTVKGYDDSWSSGTAGSTKFYYTAVKYTE